MFCIGFHDYLEKRSFWGLLLVPKFVLHFSSKISSTTATQSLQPWQFSSSRKILEWSAHILITINAKERRKVHHLVHLCPNEIKVLTFSGSRQFRRYLFAEISDSLRDCANDNHPLFIIQENYRLGLINCRNSPLGYPPDFDRSKMLASDLRKNEALPSRPVQNFNTYFCFLTSQGGIVST
jgi:hypothetical protein